MADTSWSYVIPGVGTYNDTSQDFELVVPGVGTVNEGAAAAPVGWAHDFNGVANANIGSINGIAIANIGAVNGV